jgi:hypothetical protein
MANELEKDAKGSGRGVINHSYMCLDELSKTAEK